MIGRQMQKQVKKKLEKNGNGKKNNARSCNETNQWTFWQLFTKQLLLTWHDRLTLTFNERGKEMKKKIDFATEIIKATRHRASDHKMRWIYVVLILLQQVSSVWFQWTVEWRSEEMKMRKIESLFLFVLSFKDHFSIMWFQWSLYINSIIYIIAIVTSIETIR
jgi:hypothetical protein